MSLPSDLPSDLPSINYAEEVKKLVDVENKNWNIHMLRVCSKELSNLSKKDFKTKRWYSTKTQNVTEEKRIMEQMLCDRSKQLNAEEFEKFFKRLSEFETKKRFHPRQKIIEY